MLEQFTDYNFAAESLDRIATANGIIAEYQEQGLTLTLRQLYYQFVARDIIENSERSYKNLGKVISRGREAGLVSWTAIEDRGRSSYRIQGQDNPRDVVHGLEYGILIDPWEEQENYVEVWIEKDALVGTIERVCDRNRVTYMACKGYLSASEAWRAGHRFRAADLEGKNPVIIHLGDHDPSGIDMTRDNQERSSIFAGVHVEIRRIALNMDQVEEHNPPPNPAKLSDSRAGDYVANYGTSSWELDALNPTLISQMVGKEIKSLITDHIAWDEVKDREEQARTHLRQVYDHWDEITDFLDDL